MAGWLLVRALQLPERSEALATGTFDSVANPDFWLFRRLPFGRFARRLRARSHGTRTLWLVLLAWAPLAVLSGWEGRLSAAPRSFTDDVAVQARLLIELPVLLYCRRFVDRLCGLAVGYFPLAGMVDPRRERDYRARRAGVARRRDSLLPLIAIVGLSYLASLTEFRVNSGVDWWRGAPHQLSLAGAW